MLAMAVAGFMAKQGGTTGAAQPKPAGDGNPLDDILRMARRAKA